MGGFEILLLIAISLVVVFAIVLMVRDLLKQRRPHPPQRGSGLTGSERPRQRKPPPKKE